MSKDTKILIPEIPGEWTERTRSGSKCIWNDGWHGKPCQDASDAVAKAEALAKVAESDYDEWDYRAQDECKCPHCATVIHIESEDYGDKNLDCDTCGGEFELTTEYSVTFTTKVIGERVIARPTLTNS